MPKWPAYSSQEFIKAWQQSRTVQQVADALGITRKQAIWTAGNYRERGLILKFYSRGTRYRRDWLALQKLAHDYATRRCDAKI